MAKNGETPSYLYLGLAGETGRGRVVHSGLFCIKDGSGEWQRIASTAQPATCGTA